MGIQESRKDDFPGAVHLLRSEIVSHAHNEPLRHGDVSGAELIGEHVDVDGVFQHQVRRLPSGGGLNDAAFFHQLPVNLARIALRHGITPS